MPSFRFENSYARLPERFFSRVHPVPVAAPRLLKLNVELARGLGIDPDALASEQGVAILAGNTVPQEAQPIALAYAGHQFGHFVPQLGDGRANLIGEHIAPDGTRFDIQLKGSGRTPFSRGGDGRAALGPVLREYIVSEAMYALGVPTTRALAAVATGEAVHRDQPLPGAVFTRVAASHIRVGTFQYFAVRGDVEALRLLADHAIARHDPEAAKAAKPVRAFLDGVIARHSALVAQWLSLGFVHGVMNTDNTSVSGETLDYGPCAFLEEYDPGAVFSSIDHRGRYAYDNQAQAAHWNLTRLAESLLPLLEVEEGSAEAALASAVSALEAFMPAFERARSAAFRAKLGLLTPAAGDDALVADLLECIHTQHADFTLTFRLLADAAEDHATDTVLRTLFAEPTNYDRWAALWRIRLLHESLPLTEIAARMRRANPAVIPRNHLIERVIVAALQDDLGPFERLLSAVTRPYEEDAEAADLRVPALLEERVTATFCGT